MHCCGKFITAGLLPLHRLCNKAPGVFVPESILTCRLKLTTVNLVLNYCIFALYDTLL